MFNQPCPECGKPLPSGSPDGMCPGCLLNVGLRSGGQASPGPTLPDVVAQGEWIDRYHLLERIGEGGFGTVWLAEQAEPVRRMVALKVLKLGMDTREVVARFEAERQALALMEHPNIAKVLDAGATVNGRPYFAMELVGGVPITDFCNQRRLDTRQRIELLIPVCEAVQHAHQKGVIHRDLKPSNVLVSEHDGRWLPKVIDFGIAKAIEEPLTDKTLVTRFHQFLGTPAYMSPEQAGLGGLDVDTRSDIYSLGVLLYELVTGRPPFSNRELNGQGREAMLKMIRESEPPRPSSRLTTLSPPERTALLESRRESAHELARRVKGDLDWIILKAIDKDRARRYSTANSFSADLWHYLQGEVVGAVPPTLSYRARRFALKHRLAIAVASAFLFLLLVGISATAWQAVRATRHARAEMQLRRHAESNEVHLRHTVYAADMTLAAHGLERGDDEAARQILTTHVPSRGEQDFRGWEWRHLWERAQGDRARPMLGHTNGITGLALISNGTRLLSAGADGTVREWDFARGNELRQWKADGYSWTALAVDASETNALALGPRDQGLSIDLVSGEQHLVPVETARMCYGAVASPDGHAYLHGAGGWGFNSANGLTVVHERATKKSKVLARSGSRCAFSPDGRMLATGAWGDCIKLWSWPDLEPSGELRPVKGIASLDFSPDGRFLASGAESGELSLWEVSSRTLKQRRAAHEDTVIGAVRFSRDGRFLATAAGDQRIVIWDSALLTTNRVLRGYASGVWQLRWTPDSRSLVSTTSRAGLRVWSVAGPGFQKIKGHTSTRPVRFSPDSRYLAMELADERGTVLYSADDGHEVGRTSGYRELCGFSPDGQTLILQERVRNALVFCRVPDLAVVRETPLTEESGAVPGQCAMLSPDAKQVAWACETGVVLVWDVETGRMLSRHRGHDGKVNRVAFSRDGRWLLSAGTDSVARLWATDTWRESAVFRGPRTSANAVAFSDDSRYVVVGWLNGIFVVFDRVTGGPVAQFRAGEGQAALPEDGRTLITLSHRRIQFWNVASRREAGTLTFPNEKPSFLTLSPDGGILATVASDRELKLWRAPQLNDEAPDVPGRPATTR